MVDSPIKFDSFVSSSLTKSLTGKLSYPIEIKTFRYLNKEDFLILFKSGESSYDFYTHLMIKDIDIDYFVEYFSHERKVFMNIMNSSSTLDIEYIRIILEVKWAFNHSEFNNINNIPLHNIRELVSRSKNSFNYQKDLLAHLLEVDLNNI